MILSIIISKSWDYFQKRNKILKNKIFFFQNLNIFSQITRTKTRWNRSSLKRNSKRVLKLRKLLSWKEHFLFRCVAKLDLIPLFREYFSSALAYYRQEKPFLHSQKKKNKRSFHESKNTGAQLTLFYQRWNTIELGNSTFPCARARAK